MLKMSKEEYVASGQPFEKAGAAATALDNRLKELDKIIEESTVDKEAAMKSRLAYVGVKTLVLDAIECQQGRWENVGLDRSCYRINEALKEGSYEISVDMIHPSYDPVWLTAPQVKNMSREMIPFLQYAVRVDRADCAITLSETEIKTHVNLPTFSGSPEMVREGVIAAKAAVTKIGAVQECVQALRNEIKSHVSQYASKNNLTYSDPWSEPAAEVSREGPASITKETPGHIEDRPVPGAPKGKGHGSATAPLDELDAGWETGKPDQGKKGG
jgi:hypothetical protein